MFKEGVSICITAYKAKQFIKECLDSINNQTWFKSHDNYEILLGIDGCKDTLEYVQTIMGNYKNLRVFIMDSNRGTYVTTNTLMKMAQYDGLIRFDSDDIMLPEMVEKIMRVRTGFDAVFFKMKNFGKSNAVNEACGQIYVSHETFDKLGGYRDYVCSGDLDFNKRLIKFVKIKKIDEVLLNRRTHNDSLTRAKETSYTSPIRRQINRDINSRKLNRIEDAIIECVTNTYKEITVENVKELLDNMPIVEKKEIEVMREPEVNSGKTIYKKGELAKKIQKIRRTKKYYSGNMFGNY